MRRPLPHRAVLSLVPLLIGPPLLAQSAWSKAPALPTACYSEEDAFNQDAEKARTELEAAIERQEQINRALHEQVFKTDPATLQQRFMAAVQKNPARANEIMQAMAGAGSDPLGTAAAAEGDEIEFDARKLQLKVDYEAEWKALGPVDLGSPAALAQRNQEYETGLCPKWFGKEVPDLLASYRAYLVEQRIPKRTEAEKTHLPMWELLGVSTKNFHPVAELKGVLDYVRMASDLYSRRTREPYRRP